VEGREGFMAARRLCGIAAAIALSLVGGSGSAAIVAAGTQFQVNTYTINNQVFPSVASDSVGNFIVVWGSKGNTSGDTAGYSIQGQRYDANGAALGEQFQVNTYTTGDQILPSVASGSAGNFVVVWASEGSAGSDTSGRSIQGQRYDSSGVATGGQFQVNTNTTGNQHAPSVASDSEGNFVAVWNDNYLFGHSRVEGQRYDASGAAIGAEFRVNTRVTTVQEMSPSVASNSSGNFVVIWQSGGTGSDTSGRSIEGQRYDANGAALGGQFLVNTYTTGSQRYPSVASDSAGNFVVVWDSAGGTGSDTSITSVHGQRYDSSGSAIGGEFQVNTYTTNYQRAASVASDSSGNFVVVFQSAGSGAPVGADTSGYSIQGQVYDASGSPIGGEFQVNSYTTGGQFLPAVASDSTGRFVVVWHSVGSVGSDTDQNQFSVQGQRYLPEPSFVPSLAATIALLIRLAGWRRARSCQ
jgi:hypothetical protein